MDERARLWFRKKRESQLQPLLDALVVACIGQDVELDVRLSSGALGRAAVPSGASTGGVTTTLFGSVS